MTNKINKCPNCGHQFKDGEEYCPNCDLFVPVDEQSDTDKTFDPNETKQFETFKDSTIEENETDSFPESRFKHRGISSDTEETLAKEETDGELEINDEEKMETILEKTETVDGIEEEPKLEPEPEMIDPVTPTDISYDTTEFSLATQTPETEDNLPPRQTDTKHIKDSHKKKKIIFGISAVAILIIGGGTFYSSEQKKAAEATRLELVASTEKDLSSLYTSDDMVFLKADITEDDLEQADETLNKLKTKEGYEPLKEQFDSTEDKFNKQQSLNDLFTTPLIVGDRLADNAFVVNSNEMSLKKIDVEKDGFDILYNKAIDETQKQKKELKEVEAKVAVVFKNDDVVKDATDKQYEEAKQAVDGLKDDSMKKKLNEKLKKVDTFLIAADKKKQAEEEAAAVAAQEEQNRLDAIAAAQAPVEQQQPANSSNSSNNSASSSSSGGRMGNREDSSIDLSNAAWAWNPGIQNEVMSEVIRRGYVVEGGYSLVPKFVENGEGYYDLYATTNSKIFPDSKPEEFPLYVVTINVKTGSFKGNGPN